MKNIKQSIKKGVESDYTIDEVADHYCGLFNLGNTCFINSCIQLIYHINDGELLVPEYSGELPRGARGTSGVRDISGALRQLLALMQQANKIKPLDFLEKVKDKFPQFSIGEQHDAHEFLMALLNTLQQENMDNNFPINDSFHIENDHAYSFLMENLLMNN